jgi:electron transfer flavoprotein alpha subunit
MAGGILVSSENPSLTLELLGEARRLAGTTGFPVAACALGETGPELLESYRHVADVVYTFENPADSCRWLGALRAGVDASKPSLVLLGATKTGTELACRLAERTQASYAAWAVAVDIEPKTAVVSASCMLYAGAALAKYRFSRPMTVLTAAPGAFAACDSERSEGVLAVLEPTTGDTGVTVVGERRKDRRGTGLESARTVVDVGRGVRKIEDLEMVREVAGLLDGQLGCSRPVSSDRDWMPDWLGLSGAKVRPELCLTVGVSGAIQHMIGIRDARVIAAVNNDEDAAIFSQADVGVVADLYEFLPALADRIKARAVRPAWP